LFEQEEALVKNVLTRKGSREPALQAAHIVLTDRLTVPASDDTPPLADLLAQADQSRPDLAAIDLEIKNTGIALEGTRNELLPELDVFASAQGQGLAGTPGMQAGTAMDMALAGGYGTVLQQILSQKYPTYEVGIQLNFPLRNRIAQADLRRDMLQQRAYETQVIALRNQVALEVDTATIALRRARSAYEAAVRTRQLQQESLDVEKARYEAGVDTAFFVIQYQAYLSQAESTEVVAKGDYFKALAGLNLATGTLLEKNNISIDEAYRGKVTTPPTPISH
jgi:outer membrane protein TolC